MAQPGNFTPILLYASSTPGNVPLAANLTNNTTGSEIAINVADKNLFFKDSGGTVNTVPIRQSGTSSNGWLSSTDWNTFNNKQPAGTYVTSISIASSNGFTGTSSGGATPSLTLATSVTGLLKGNGTAISAATSGTDYAPATSGSSILYGNGAGGFSNVTIGTGVSFVGGTLSATGSGGTVTSVSGTTGRITSTGGTTPIIDLASGIATAGTTGSSTLIPVVTIDTYGRVTGITTASNPQGTVTSVAALTLGTTGTDLSSTVANGTTTPVITLNVPTASATNRGALSSTDWSTFNGKQAALVSGTNIKTVGGVSLLGSGDVGTIGTGYGGTGLTSFTANGILYASSTSALATNSNFTWTTSQFTSSTATTTFGAGTVASKIQLNVGGSTAAGTFEILGGGSGNPTWDFGTGFSATTFSLGYSLSASRTELLRVNPTYFQFNKDIYVSGNASVGTGSDNCNITLNTAGASGKQGLLLIASGGSGNPQWDIGTYSATTALTVGYTYSSSRIEIARFFGSGGVSIGNTTDPGATNLSVNGAISSGGWSAGLVPSGGVGAITTSAGSQGLTAWNKATSGTIYYAYFGYNTTFTNTGSITYNGINTLYNATSDQRLKENIADSNSGLDKLANIKIRSFDWKTSGLHTDFGVIAQELYEIAPEVVSEGIDNEDGTIKTPWQVDTSALVPAMIKAIQELKAQFDAYVASHP